MRCCTRVDDGSGYGVQNNPFSRKELAARSAARPLLTNSADVNGFTEYNYILIAGEL